MSRVQDVVRAVRNIRAKFNLAPKARLAAVVAVDKPEWGESLTAFAEVIQAQAGLSELQVGEGLAKPEPAAAEVLDGARVFVPLAGLMDVEVERQRIGREMEKKLKALDGLRQKMSNPEFLAKAPESVVAGEEKRREDLERQVRDLEELARSLG